jgi:aryl-alcohol dehydrogenase-like predicted oxidoreductase
MRTRTDRYQLADTAVWRVGYGAMQLAGPGVFGPPDDHDEAIAVLREAVGAGVDHIDTSHYYGPAVVNELIREALSPFPDSLALVSKVGGRRGGYGVSPEVTTDAIKVLRQRFGTRLLRRHLEPEPTEAPRMYRRLWQALTALMPILLEAK